MRRMKTRDEVLAEHPLVKVLEARGVQLVGEGEEQSCKCPFHKDRHASMSVNDSKGTWFCHACNIGGSVIDFIARADNRQPADVFKELAVNGSEGWKPLQKAKAMFMGKTNQSDGTRPKVVKVYDYHGPTGDLVYQSCRCEPKSFRQRRPDPDNPGKWAWNMNGVVRVLYRLPKLMQAASKTVWIVEGEKDADTLAGLGMVSTTNVGGAGKWCEAYADIFRGKEVVLCGDNDEPGRKHIEDVLESMAGKASVVRHVTVPQPHKDISELIEAAESKDSALADLERLYNDAVVFDRGVSLPVRSVYELEQEFRVSLARSQENSLDLGRWLPELGRHARPIVPGELVVIAADTAVGKTAILQNIAIKAAPLVTLLFEMELPGTLTFERFAALATGRTTHDVHREYLAGGAVPWRESKMLDHVFVCSRSKFSPGQIEELVVKSELKIGVKPALVMVDYMQLIKGTGGSRYERASAAAEELKDLAKATNVVLVVASQIARRKGEDNDGQVHLHDCKDSGSIENSAGLLLGVWRDDEDRTLMKVRVLKNTKGVPGRVIECDFDGAKMLVTERSKVGGDELKAK